MATINADLRVTANVRIADDTYALRFHSPELAASLRPGQFLNILTSEQIDPLLRRPYSISDVVGEECEIMYALLGKGTHALARKVPGDTIGVLGPLGNTFGYDKDFGTAIIVAGGIGIAPFPFLTKELRRREIPLMTFLGARNAGRVVSRGLENQHIATDDGSAGRQGTVIDLLGAHLDSHAVDRPRIFACGPNPMLEATQRFAHARGIPCELSLESEMACGIGICQGCPVERHEGERKYALVCTEGPCFDSQDIIFHEHPHA
ncbi:MAG: dihydroorotate dehydrogenase electron transfer subunit [Bacteroidota bacterium]|jgi:dihydroorotate dehydrogenase electron transfer subunit|nr:dihydroorotate dehydrogenase electron transfer subunit [Bacteroidota bacterium]